MDLDDVNGVQLEVDTFKHEPNWWKRYAIYEIYVRSFKDSTGNGTGDLKGIIEKLDYLEWLGVKVIWMSAVCCSPMADFGYDVSNYRDIDPTFGTLEDFRALLKEMHDRNMYLIMDFIASHTSDQHPWFIKSKQKIEPYADYYVWAAPKPKEAMPSGSSSSATLESKAKTTIRNDAEVEKDERGQSLETTNDDGDTKNRNEDNLTTEIGGNQWDGLFGPSESKLKDTGENNEESDKKPPTSWGSVFGGSVWEWCEERNEYFLHNFLDKQPDLNFHNPLVRKEMKEILQFWVEVGVDGFRADAVSFLIHDETLKGGSDKGLQERPETFAIIKEWADFVKSLEAQHGKHLFFMTEAYASMDHIKDYHRTGIDFPFNFTISSWSAGSSADYLKRKIVEWMDMVSSEKDANWWPNWVLANHDLRRVATRLADPVFSDAANMILLLLPGTPTCYYGEELGLSDVEITKAQIQDPVGFTKGLNASRDPCRSPMPWNGSNLNAGFTTAEMPWLPLNSDWKTLNVESQKAEPFSHLNIFRELLHLKQEDPVLSQNSGRNLIFLESGSEDILMFLRLPEIEEVNHGYLAILHVGTCADSQTTAKLGKFELNFGPNFSITSGTLVLTANATSNEFICPYSGGIFRKKSRRYIRENDLKSEISFNEEMWLNKGQIMLLKVDLLNCALIQESHPKLKSPSFIRNAINNYKCTIM